MLENVEFLPKKSEFRLGDVKNLAVTTNQKDDIAKMYPKVENIIVSNADMLSQSFGGGQTSVLEIPKVDTVSDPVQISGIPNIQNTNMEDKPVDLSINPMLDTSLNASTFDNSGLSIPTVSEQTNNVLPNNVPVVEPVNSDNNVVSNDIIKNELPKIEPINSDNNVVSNDTMNNFQVSNQPNIFDNPSMPFNINQEEINKPLEDNKINEQEKSFLPNENIKNDTLNSFDNKDNSLNDDIILAQITIEESNVKHYEALAENSKKKIEVLKRQIKNKNEEVNLENTASNLFNNNGALDDEKILGKVPMPNLISA